MAKFLAIIIMALFIALPASATKPTAATPHPEQHIQALPDTPQFDDAACEQSLGKFPEELNIAQGGCCRVCRKGKACGNSCISRSYNCTRPRGCACDG